MKRTTSERARARRPLNFFGPALLAAPALLTGLVLALTGCAGDETVGGYSDWFITLDLRPGASSSTQTIDIQSEEAFQQVVGDIACANFDTAASTLSLSGYTPGDNGPADGDAFSLTGTIIDPSDGSELRLFTWSSSLSQTAKQVTLQSSTVDLNQEAVTRISEIVAGRSDKSFEVRYTFESATLPDSTRFSITHRIRYANENGTCP